LWSRKCLTFHKVCLGPGVLFRVAEFDTFNTVCSGGSSFSNYMFFEYTYAGVALFQYNILTPALVCLQKHVRLIISMGNFFSNLSALGSGRGGSGVWSHCSEFCFFFTNSSIQIRAFPNATPVSKILKSLPLDQKDERRRSVWLGQADFSKIAQSKQKFIKHVSCVFI